jgi:hypothetical protein
MSNTNDIVGTRIGVIDILYECDFKHKDGHKMYHVKCSECDWESDLRKSDIKRMTRCVHVGAGGNYINFKNSWGNKRLRSIFSNMKQRCYNENDKDYRWYGAKGIIICDEWLNNTKLFEEWALNNGYKDGLTIDRIDENKNYCPENCEWVSCGDNSKYKSTTSLIDVDGVIHTGKDWSKILGLGTNVINRYVRQFGKDNTIEFIKRYKQNPDLKPHNKNQSIYSVYMN